LNILKADFDIEYVPGLAEKVLEERLGMHDIRLPEANLPFTMKEIKEIMNKEEVYIDYKREINFRDEEPPLKKIIYSRSMYFDGTDFCSFLRDFVNAEDKGNEDIDFDLCRIPRKSWHVRSVNIQRPAKKKVNETYLSEDNSGKYYINRATGDKYIRAKDEVGLSGNKYIFSKAFNKYFGSRILSNSKFRVVPEPYYPGGKNHNYIEPPGSFVISQINDAAREAGLFEGKGQYEIKFEDYINMMVDYFCTVPAKKI